MTWTSLEMALLTDSHTSGLDVDATADRIPSRTRKAIASKIRRLKDLKPRPNPWTYERVMRLKELRAIGMSARLIGEDLGMTRNAIIGKLHRIGMVSPSVVMTSNGHTVTSANRFKMTPVKGAKRRQPRRQPRSWSPKSPILPPREITDLPADKSENPVTLFDLQPHHCRYPAGNESPAKWFCGDQVAEGKPYCPRHYRIAYQPSPRMDPQERAMRALWWTRQITPPGQSPVSPLESSLGQPAGRGEHE